MSRVCCLLVVMVCFTSLCNVRADESEMDNPDFVIERARELRDPFLPPGVNRIDDPRQTVDEQRPTAPVEWDRARGNLRVYGVMRFGNEQMANINNLVVGVGDEVRVDMDGRRYRWRVMEIDGETVSFQRLESELLEEIEPGDNHPAPE